MITSRIRLRFTAAALTIGALLATASTTATATTTTGAAAGAPSASSECPAPQPLYAAADSRVDLGALSPEPSYRVNCAPLYRADGRAPEVVFDQGFRPKDVVHGQYDLAAYVDRNQPSPFVSTSYDHDLYKQWRSAYNYYIDAPGGIDVNETIGFTHRWADQVEVAFPGGVARTFIVKACPIDKPTKTEILAKCVDNPNYTPWRD
ncbi:ADP-ribosyltransferase [Streptomyces beijiangensis]|uniref:Pierisin-like domain-containing protein n=1 Tax=Streptomyces beijiangensis TaxID=163361 RepID=A0A939F3T7_9ACTN|nr:ADP-ribosyltransferase [Streptomyces beijiangensis]MBO0510899.1 hypothetical protein [Streptomyces beijiangensis]